MSDDKKQGLSLTDLAKKIVLTSIGSAALARDVVRDGGTQKKMIGSILNRAERTKDEVMDLLARELNKFLGKINISEEVTKALRGLVINLNASIDFKDKKGEGIKPRGRIRKAAVKKKSH